MNWEKVVEEYNSMSKKEQSKHIDLFYRVWNVPLCRELTKLCNEYQSTFIDDFLNTYQDASTEIVETISVSLNRYSFLKRYRSRRLKNILENKRYSSRRLKNILKNILKKYNTCKAKLILLWNKIAKALKELRYELLVLFKKRWVIVEEGFLRAIDDFHYDLFVRFADNKWWVYDIRDEPSTLFIEVDEDGKRTYIGKSLEEAINPISILNERKRASWFKVRKYIRCFRKRTGKRFAE